LFQPHVVNKAVEHEEVLADDQGHDLNSDDAGDEPRHEFLQEEVLPEWIRGG
jgi:hypothetical protein